MVENVWPGQRWGRVRRCMEVAREVARTQKHNKGLQLVAVTPCFNGGEIGIRTLGTFRYT
jgi:hypothetical protein